ncbi:uncharacterized protein LOC131944606 [Physella acuta]|uniref:uncharacterized protein LOC131944606 n=1 Tax=Physella acuta TaxID=109671 RepID=UPI0027DB6485|nr:uncharacterized protein LOC131944606 [Physella acuta]
MTLKYFSASYSIGNVGLYESLQHSPTEDPEYLPFVDGSSVNRNSADPEYLTFVDGSPVNRNSADPEYVTIVDDPPSSGNSDDVSSQIQPAVTSLENVAAKLTIIIPNTQLANDAVLITITNNLTVGTVVYLFPNTWAFKPNKPNDIIVTVNKSERKVEINIKSVRAQDAGNYKCFHGSSDVALDNCGQMLIVLRKPNPPVITVLSSPLEGETLKLSCTTNSLALPPDHGLPTLVWWMDQNGVYLVSGSKPRININAKNELELSSVQRTDKGQKFSCKSADGTIDFPKEKLLESASSNVYEVIPEYKPLLADMTITPAVSSDGQISKNIGDQISYTCDISCYPVCEVKWLFKAHGKTSFDPMPSLVDTKVLTLGVSRSSHGVYRCMGTNPHGSVQKDFNLNVQYLESPRMSINDKQISSDKIVEREAAILQCTFDANPKPHIRWFLPNDEEIVVFELNSIPQLNTASSGILEHLYTSKAKINDLRCENSGVYRCEGSNSLTQVEGRMELSVMCPPTSSSVYTDLELKPNYVWEIPKSLSFSFVIRGFPEPTVQRVVSDVKGSKRQEKIPEDVEFTKESKYDGKPYMTKFTFFSRRKLDQTDMDREFTVTFESSEFKRDLKFVISPRGPPHVVTNITSVDVKHDSVKIFWISSFDGGEKQTFSVHYRPYSSKMDGEWSVAVENIKPIMALEVWNEAIVKSLSASTEYEMKVVAINVLGQAESEPLRIKTTAAPGEPLSAGAIVGVVIGVLTFIIIFLVLYLLVLRKKLREEKTTSSTTTESRAPHFCPIFPDCLLTKKGKETNVPDPDYLIIVDSPPTRKNSVCVNTDEPEYLIVVDSPNTQRRLNGKEKTTANRTTESRAPVFCPIYRGCLVRKKTLEKYVPGKLPVKLIGYPSALSYV